MTHQKKGRRGNRQSKGRGKKISPISAADSLSFHTRMDILKKQVEQLLEMSLRADERIQDMEIHVNLLTRLLTTLCVEKFGMRVGVLKRLIKRIEKETIRDSQISHLEFLYKLPHRSDPYKGSPPRSGRKNDAWDDIS